MDFLRVIGKGTCGTVFSTSTSSRAYKKGQDESSIWRDFVTTNEAYNASVAVSGVLQQKFPNLCLPRIPRCQDFHLAYDSEFWTPKQIALFPKEAEDDYRRAQPLFSGDRIPAVSEALRDVLIDRFFSTGAGVQNAARRDPENQDCLIRLYLGERETEEQEQEAICSLRNFPLRLNMLEALASHFPDKKTLVQELAIGLAMVHWAARSDSMDVEFVLGSFATPTPSYATASTGQGVKSQTIGSRGKQVERDLHLWILDFDKARSISLTKHDVKKKLVPAFLGNDPYFPLPDGSELWEWFAETYLKASQTILWQVRPGSMMSRNEVSGLPETFLAEIKSVWEEKMKNWDPETEIVFGD